MLAPKSFERTLLLLSICIFFAHKVTYGQIVIGSPTLGFSQACANEDFNNFNLSFVFSPESALGSSNQFIVELSDASGDFSNAEIVYTSSENEFTSSPASINFQLPNTTAGENYRVRIKSTAPAATSSGSSPFAAYYKLQDSPFTINNLVATGAFCTGSSYLLTIDDPGSPTNDSPLNYPSLTFNWFKETGPTTSVFVAEGNSLEVTEEGTYFVETNYGTCTSNSFSNRVTITEVTNGNADISINSSLGNPFCPENGGTVLTTVDALSYQWFKDGAIIDDATEQTLVAAISGEYTVQVNLGGCSATGNISLVSEGFNSSIDVAEEVNMLEGESINVTVTDDAVNPIYEWYLNGTLLNTATSNSLEISAFGEYEVLIIQNDVCQAVQSFIFNVAEGVNPFPDVPEIPNIVSPNGDFINDSWIIPPMYTEGTNTQVTIYNSSGQIVFNTQNYENNWPQDANEVRSNQLFYYILQQDNGSLIKGTITVIK